MQAGNGWVEVRSPEGRFLFRFHPERQLIEIKQGKEYCLVDLPALQQLCNGGNGSRPAVFTAPAVVQKRKTV